MVWKCPPGFIVRKGYHRDDYVKKDGTRVKGAYVPPSCVIDKGAPGKGVKVISSLERGKLSRFGYHLKDGLAKRQTALRKAVTADGALTIFHRVHALSILHKRTNPSYAKKAGVDASWISRNFLGKNK
jgi:hypothetical protein